MSSYTIEVDLLKQYVSRIEKLEEEKNTVQDGIKEIYANAKNHGFDVKVLKQIIKLRKIDDQELIEQEAILDLYKSALGMKANIEE